MSLKQRTGKGDLHALDPLIVVGNHHDDDEDHHHHPHPHPHEKGRERGDVAFGLWPCCSLMGVILGLVAIIGGSIWVGTLQRESNNQRELLDLQQMAIDGLLLPLLDNVTADNVINGTYGLAARAVHFDTPGGPGFNSGDLNWISPVVYFDTGTCRLNEFELGGGVRIGVVEFDPITTSIALAADADVAMAVHIQACSATRLNSFKFQPFIALSDLEAAFFTPPLPLPWLDSTGNPSFILPAFEVGLMLTGNVINFVYYNTETFCGFAGTFPACNVPIPGGSIWTLPVQLRYVAEISAI